MRTNFLDANNTFGLLEDFEVNKNKRGKNKTNLKTIELENKFFKYKAEIIFLSNPRMNKALFRQLVSTAESLIKLRFFTINKESNVEIDEERLFAYYIDLRDWDNRTLDIFELIDDKRV